MAATRECPGCALPVPKDAEQCPYCQYEFPPRPRLWQWTALIVLLAFLLPFLLWLRNLLR